MQKLSGLALELVMTVILTIVMCLYNYPIYSCAPLCQPVEFGTHSSSLTLARKMYKIHRCVGNFWTASSVLSGISNLITDEDRQRLLNHLEASWTFLASVNKLNHVESTLPIATVQELDTSEDM